MLSVGIITASDKGARGEREDESGRVITETLESVGGKIKGYGIVPDDKSAIEAKLVEYCDSMKLDLVLTTGGTGLGPRDVTPEATLSVIERQIPGIAEAMRAGSLKYTPMAMLSRAVAGTRGKTLIINLPGSPKAVRECLQIVLPVLRHAIGVLKGEASECARLRQD